VRYSAQHGSALDPRVIDSCIVEKRKKERKEKRRKRTTVLSSFLLQYFLKHNTNTDTHTRMSTHPYEYTDVHPTPMSTSKTLSQLDFDIHEVGHEERLTVDGEDASH
jgi:hypothetical protein